MKRVTGVLLLGVICAVPTSAQSVATPGQAPRLETGAAASAGALLGSVPRLGSVTGRTTVATVPVDVTRNSVVPLQLVQPQVVSPRQPTLLNRLRQLLPFATRTGAAVVAPEAVILHDSLPEITIK